MENKNLAKENLQIVKNEIAKLPPAELERLNAAILDIKSLVLLHGKYVAIAVAILGAELAALPADLAKGEKRLDKKDFASEGEA